MSSPALREHLDRHGYLWGPDTVPYPISGFMTYGPLGKKLKNNLEHEFVQLFETEGFEPLETPLLQASEQWQASGHLTRFGDEMFATATSSGRPLRARPELATTIYPLFKKILSAQGGSLPLRVYQSGISLPNERQTEWQLRTRQYTAHEGHIIQRKNQTNPEEQVSYLLELGMSLLAAAGIRPGSLDLQAKPSSDKPFYASDAHGIYTEYEGKDVELLGVQYRGSGDFEAHSHSTGVNLQIGGEFPEAYEISFSTDRPFLILLARSLQKIGKRTVLSLPPNLAPIPAQIAAVDKDLEMHEVATCLQSAFSRHGTALKIVNPGNIGARYRAADAKGVPYVLTVDKQSPHDHSFTIRDRDSTAQSRVSRQEFETQLSSTGAPIKPWEFMARLFERGRKDETA